MIELKSEIQTTNSEKKGLNCEIQTTNSEEKRVEL